MDIYQETTPVVEEPTAIAPETMPEDAGTEQNTAPQTSEPAPQTTAAEPEKFRVRYNHEDVELTRDELIERAQKGMNYDHVYEELQRLREDPRLARAEALEKAAQQQGLSAEELLRRTSDAGIQADVQKLVGEGYEEKEAREIVDGRRAKARLEIIDRQLREDGKRRADLAEFRQLFPDIPVKDVPQEVWDAVNKGRTLTDSYMRYERTESVRRATAEAQNQKNTASAAPAPPKTAPATPKHFTQAEVAKMSQEEVRKNYDRIIQSMPLWK